MTKMIKRTLWRLLPLLLVFSLVFGLAACTADDALEVIGIAEDIVGMLEEVEVGEGEYYDDGYYDGSDDARAPPVDEQPPIDKDGYYYSKDEVALYLHTYGELPPNYITKDEAEELGWQGGSIEDYFEGGAIGGSSFGNREGLLPKKDGRTYRECDIDTKGKSKRGEKRLVYSNDGLIFYTDDHYESFTQLY